MAKTLSQRVEIGREGTLRRGLGEDASKAWVDHENITSRYDGDIAQTAMDAGYEIGDTFTYRIVIEPKK